MLDFVKKLKRIVRFQTCFAKKVVESKDLMKECKWLRIRVNKI